MAGLAGAPAARAQTAEQTVDVQDVGVLERPRPEYQAFGIHLGAFQVYPSLTITPEYDDNIFATDTDKTGDFVTAITPSIRAQSNWSRNELDGYARLTTNIFAKDSGEGTTDYSVGGGGRLDLLARTNITASFNYSHSTEPRTAENTVEDARDPIQYDTESARLGASNTFNRLTLSGGVSVDRFDYDNSETFSGAFLSQAYRNVTIAGVYGTATYAYSPALSIFGSLHYDDRMYDQKPPQTLFDRSSDGVEGTVGVNIDLTRLMRGSFEIGYFERSYDQVGYPRVDGPALHGRIEYFLTPLTTLTFSANRSVIDAADPIAISFTQTEGSFQVDHELRRNIILSGRATYEYDDYTGVDRTDKRPLLSLSGTYLFNRHLGLTAAYTYLDQDSSGLARTNNFSVNIISLSLVLQL